MRDLCTKYNVLLIYDEVITGFGRTGENYWGFQNFDVVPDFVVI